MHKIKPGFMAPRVFERERAHRRWVVVAVLFLLFFSTSPIFGHHLAQSITDSLVGRDHVLSLCLVALHQLMAPVHDIFHILVVIGFVYAVYDRVRAMRRLHQTLQLLQYSITSPDSSSGRAAHSVGVDHNHVRVTQNASVPAFTAGLWRPSIFLDESLIMKLPVAELAAVIAHEDAHRRRRDPLRLSIWRFLSCLLFFLPALRRLAEDMADEAEIAADDDAVARSRVHPLTLAAALISVASASSRRVSTLPGQVTAFHRDDILERRVRRLAGEDTLIGTHVTRASALSAVLALCAVGLSGMVVTHPLPQSGAAHGSSHVDVHHCEHENNSPFSHLFCLRSEGSPLGGVGSNDCPHSN